MSTSREYGSPSSSWTFVARLDFTISQSSRTKSRVRPVQIGIQNGTERGRAGEDRDGLDLRAARGSFSTGGIGAISVQVRVDCRLEVN